MDWAVSVTHKAGEAFAIAKGLIGRTDLVAAYGGDGTVMEVARALHGSNTPMAILPGGTANVMAKELDIPLDSQEAIRLLSAPDSILKEVDMGLVNGCPFLIRVNLGILADMITEASPETKDRWGQWAYGITAFQTLQQESRLFRLTIDGVAITQEAVALTITNAGNIGRKGYAFLPGISVSDGWLDVIALDKADLTSLLKVTGSVLFQTDSSVLKHWRAKEIQIHTEDDNQFLCDDTAETARDLHIRISPRSLKILVPAKTIGE